MIALSARSAPVHVESKFARAYADGQKFFASDDDLALWNKDAVDDPAVQHPHNVRPQIFSDDCIYNVGRQSERGALRRPHIEQRHFFFFPQPHGMEDQQTTSGIFGKTISRCGTKNLRVCAEDEQNSAWCAHA